VLEIFSHIEPELLDALNIAKKLKSIEFRRIELLTFELEEPQYLICVFQLEAGSKFSRTVSFEMIRVENLNGNLRIKSIPGFLSQNRGQQTNLKRPRIRGQQEIVVNRQISKDQGDHLARIARKASE
jgi:hypothetical protein